MQKLLGIFKETITGIPSTMFSMREDLGGPLDDWIQGIMIHSADNDS